MVHGQGDAPGDPAAGCHARGRLYGRPIQNERSKVRGRARQGLGGGGAPRVLLGPAGTSKAARRCLLAEAAADRKGRGQEELVVAHLNSGGPSLSLRKRPSPPPSPSALPPLPAGQLLLDLISVSSARSPRRSGEPASRSPLSSLVSTSPGDLAMRVGGGELQETWMGTDARRLAVPPCAPPETHPAPLLIVPSAILLGDGPDFPCHRH